MAHSHESEIETLERAFWRCMVTKNVAEATAMVGPTCTIAGAQGVSAMTRDQFAAAMEGGAWELLSFEMSDMKVNFPAADVAVVAYKVSERLRVKGEEIAFDAADTSVWVRGDDRTWLCVLHTETPLGDPFGRAGGTAPGQP